MQQYHYSECGLDNIYLLNGFEITKHKNDIEIFIHDIHGLHKAIGMYLVEKQGLLVGTEIKFIRTTLDLSQTKLANLLGCNYQTILAWEKNKTPISSSADKLLRILFHDFINPEKDRTIFELINKIADLEAKETVEQKLMFKEHAEQWQLVA